MRFFKAKPHFFLFLLSVLAGRESLGAQGKLLVETLFPAYLSASTLLVKGIKKGPGLSWGYDHAINSRSTFGPSGRFLTGSGLSITYFDFPLVYKYYWIGGPLHVFNANEDFQIEVRNKSRFYTGASIGTTKVVVNTLVEIQPLLPADLTNIGIPLGYEIPIRDDWGFHASFVGGYARGGGSSRKVTLKYFILGAGAYYEL